LHAGRGRSARASRRDDRSSDQPASTDTIHVHIDRIEVRAVMPPVERAAAARPRAASPQPLSLDDYLSQRTRR
jgi:hypothetical protein